jgi:tetratricopeptide (TPR) repeat protein
MANESLTCFLVAPFGDKKVEGEGFVGNFELLRSVIKEIVEAYPDISIKLKRADEIVDVGSIGETFILALHKADIVVADLSHTLNANVFYELGIRYSLRRRVTIPIWQRGTKLPADLQGTLGVEYEPTNPKANTDAFHRFIRQRLQSQLTDSPIYKVLPDLAVIEAGELNALREKASDLEKRLRGALLDDAVETVWAEARDLLAKSAPEAALKKLAIAYEHSPENIRLSLEYGKLLSRQKHHEDSVRILNDAVKLSQEAGGPMSVVCRELGMAYSRWGKSRLAVDWLEKAVAEDPADADAHGIIGGVYKKELEIEKAIEAYERGYDADEKSTYCLLNILALRLIRNETGDPLRVKRYLPAADQLTQDRVGTEGADHWAYFDRAHFLLFADKGSEAVEVFKKALAETKTIGDVESARKNLELLKEFQAPVKDLDIVMALFSHRTAELSA